MTTQEYFTRWKSLGLNMKYKTLDKLKNEMHKRWDGESLKAVEELIPKMEDHIRKCEN